LQDRLAELEARLARLETPPANPPPTNPPPASPASVRVKPAVPPFRLIGVESRAGELFAAILPAGVSALVQARLLRVGDQADDWRLEVLEASAATFLHAGGRRAKLAPAGSGL
jgi:hypothetical protein